MFIVKVNSEENMNMYEIILWVNIRRRMFTRKRKRISCNMFADFTVFIFY